MADSKEQGFMAQLAASIKANPPLAMADDTKLKMTVGNITALLRNFYEAGYKQGQGSKSLFEDIFGKKRDKNG